MSEINGIAKEIVKTIREDKNKGTKPYDTQATVMRVEDGIAWVRIPGGVDETPAQLTMDAKEGDNVQVRVSGGRAWLAGNGTSPPTDDTKAVEANENAKSASIAARAAFNAAENAQTDAERAHYAAEQAETDAAEAKTSAGEAKTQATAATNYANGALTGLSTVQDVIGVLDWAQKNAQYSLTADTDIVPGKTYWTRSGSGTEADPYTYAPVVSPVKTQLSNYYEISGVDEAMADYINTHLAMLDDGLYVLSDGSGWKVRIANDGVYIVDPQGNTATKYKDAVTLGNDDGSQSYQYLDYHSMQLIDKEGNPCHRY